MSLNLPRMKAILRHKGYRLYSRPYELNIVGLRSRSVVPNRFDDEIHVFYKVSALNWKYHIFQATTDPGTYWLRQPMQPQGTAILAQGQYKDSYQLGLHQGKYLALVQRRPVAIIRDYNRDALLDFGNGQRSTGLFGINIHHASNSGITRTVDKYSAGCQVLAGINDFNFLMGLCNKHQQLYGNRFTYTLIDFRAVNRQNWRYALTGIGMAGIAGLGYLAWHHNSSIYSSPNASDSIRN